VAWVKHDVAIVDDAGKIIFTQRDVEAPESWSPLAVKVVASKYFYGEIGSPQRENSVRQLIHRVCSTIADAGMAGGYFQAEERAIFYNEMAWLCLNQHVAFNSPVWFNVGLYHRYGVGGQSAGNYVYEDGKAVRADGQFKSPQASACFLNRVEDNMESIMDLAKTEAMLFKFGSGTGTNLSSIRSSREKLTGGGMPSGPMSFLRIYDQVGNVVKSGGRVRRAAKMNILNDSHGDIEEFIEAKMLEEKKAHALIEAGYDGSFNGEVYRNSVAFQNENLSVRASDNFMRAALGDGVWHTRAITTGEILECKDARKLLQKIAEGTWSCGDPGMQFDDTIQKWHTVSGTERCNTTNPCAEFVHLDNTACNLASINLMKFKDCRGEFDIERFKAAVDILITAQDILVDLGSYPTPEIAINSHRFRPLGVGYSNLGALVMSKGHPYDSDEARGMAASIAAIMTGEAYTQSARLAAAFGPFKGLDNPECAHVPRERCQDKSNRPSMMRVIRQHRQASYALPPSSLAMAACDCWDQALSLGEAHGYRNSQVSVLAPTGCLVSGTLIHTDQGLVSLESMGDEMGEQWQDIDIQVQTDEGPKKATKFYLNGMAETRKIVTDHGYIIHGTGGHRVKIVDPDSGKFTWMKLEELAEGDLIPLRLGGMVGSSQQVSLPQFKSFHGNFSERLKVPSVMTKELAEFVGYFMGDGCWHSKKISVVVFQDDLDVVERLKFLIHYLFGLDAVIYPGTGTISVNAVSAALTRWWKVCGFDKTTNQDEFNIPPGGRDFCPRIPSLILKTNDPEIYAAFLRGLFEADGCGSGAYLAAKDEAFCQQIMTLMLALGIPVKKRAKPSGLGGMVYGMRMANNDYIEVFTQKIDFISARKKKAIRDILTAAKRQPGRKDYVPLTLAQLKMAAELVPELKDRLIDSIRHGKTTRSTAACLIGTQAEFLLENKLDYFYSAVDVNENGDLQMTYDLSVPENVTYLANGFISHNTISFMMDCATTGVEPDIALIKYKTLAGGGSLKIVNDVIPEALRGLGYGEPEVASIVAHVNKHDTIEGSALKDEHLPIFDCAFRPKNGRRFISHMGHVKMMAAVTPFISGAVSKTVNVPSDCTVEDIKDIYVQAWKLGVKCISIYRDNSKRSQPLNTEKGKNDGNGHAAKAELKSHSNGHSNGHSTKAELERLIAENKDLWSRVTKLGQPVRRRLPETRQAVTHKFDIGGHEGYVTVGLFPDGAPGEVFITMSKEGSTVGGLMDVIGTLTSMALQYGVSLDALTDKFSHMRFEPQGITKNPGIRMASSIVDYVFRWLRQQFPATAVADKTQKEVAAPIKVLASALPHLQQDAPACPRCGHITVRSGTCYRCNNCGDSLGCS
jgi:ribonucleoside-diphosphate reductase alpha chain